MLRPFEIVFAGPAAGTVASAHFGALIDAGNLLCCDVGGTSCDISLVTEGKPFVNTTFQLEHDLIVNALSNEVSSIGAGGGSLVTISAAGEVQVGPGSAGANPGPACYGKGGTQPTTTDTCLMMGIIDPGGFAGGRMKLDKAARGARSSSWTRRCRCPTGSATPSTLGSTTSPRVSPRSRPAWDRSARLQPRRVRRGRADAAAGRARPVHAGEVIVPPHPGLFSALGLLSSDLATATAAAPTRCSHAERRRRSTRCSGRWRTGCGSGARIAVADLTSSAGSMADWSGRPGRRRSFRVPAGPITARRSQR